MVHTGNFTTEVTGTQFSVEKDSINKQVSVFLYSGKVSLYNNDKFIKSLSPQEGFIFDEVTQKEVIKKQTIPLLKKESPLNDLSRNMSVTYQNIPLQDAYKDWAKKSGVEVDLSKVSIPEDTYITLSLEDKSAMEILEKLNLFYKFSYTRSENKIIILK